MEDEKECPVLSHLGRNFSIEMKHYPMDDYHWKEYEKKMSRYRQVSLEAFNRQEIDEQFGR